MSTFYYAVCDRCRVVSKVLAGRSFPNRWWTNDEGEFEAFLEQHGGCTALRLVSEHDDVTLDYREIEKLASEEPS